MMNEYAASCSQLVKLVNAAQAIRHSLACTICLELFKKPVTIKCGHKFCRSCILKVATNENATCPLCNYKIQKRSIPKEGSALLESCVKQFNVLTEAIHSDSGIDVLEPITKVKHTKESVIPHDRPSTCRVEEASTTSRGSGNSRVNPRSSKKLSLQKKTAGTKAPNDKNTLHRYLSSKSEYVPDQEVHSQEKVKSWLKSVTPVVDDVATNSDDASSSANQCTANPITSKKNQERHAQENVESWPKDVTPVIDDVVDSNPKDASSSSNKCTENSISKKSPFTALKESYDKSLPKTYSNKTASLFDVSGSTNQNTTEGSKYKEIEKRLLEQEMMAKRKGLNQSLSDKAIIKTPSSVPAASHSPAYDWRRVKRVGKEMQVNTFKSLNVSKEKSSSSVLLDDTVACNSTNNDSKNVSRDSSSNMYSPRKDTVASETKEKKSSKTNDSSQQKGSSKNALKDCSYKNHSMDSSSSHKEENTSLSCLDPKQVDEIIGILPAQDNESTPEKTRFICNASNRESTLKSNELSPFKINPNPEHQESHLSGEESNLDSKFTIVNSPPKHRLTLKMKLTNSTSSKSTRSHPSTPDKMCQTRNESPKNLSPDRPKSRLSLRLPSNKTTEHNLNQNKSPKRGGIDNSRSSQSSNFINNRKSPRSWNRKIVAFKKLGKICKKRKIISFLKLGNLCGKNEHKTGVKIVSDVTTNIDFKSIKANENKKHNNPSTVPQVSKEVKMISPEKDSQLKYLSVESPSHQHHMTARVNDSEPRQSNVPMEIDETLPSEIQILKRPSVRQEIAMANNEPSENCDNVVMENVENEPKQSTSNHGKLVENTENYLHTKNLPDSPSKQYKKVTEDIETDITKINKSLRTNSDAVKTHSMPILESESSTDIEINVIDNNSDISEHDENLCPKNMEICEVQEDAISISSNETESINVESYFTSKTVEKKNIDLDKKSKCRDSEVESVTSESSLIYVPKHQQKLKEKKAVSRSRSNSPLKKKRTHSESSNDDDVTSIIGQWCGKTTEEPTIKKPKVVSNNQKDSNQIKRKSKHLEDSFSDDNDNTLVDDHPKQSEIKKPERDPPIDDIITKVKSFKEADDNISKLTGIPSSLQSADLFESNEQCTKPRAQTSKQLNEVTSDKSLISTWSPNKDSDKENVNENRNSSETTIVDLQQFDKNKSNVSICSESSDKENKALNKMNVTTSNIEDRVDEIGCSQNVKHVEEKNDTVSSQLDLYHVPDSLMNITQEQLALKNIEKDLIGADLSTINNDLQKEMHDSNKFATPRRKATTSRINNIADDDFDSENIGATPVAKRRQVYNHFPNKTTSAEVNSSEIFLPDESLNLIPAVTPMRNTRSYPLCHSTPMMNTPSPENKLSNKMRNITLICSSLLPENIKIVQNFAKKFKANFQTSFNKDVTHVIVQTDPETKAGQKTFKYIQGIAFKKYVISFQWIVDCLNQDALLDEDQEQYEVLDHYTLTCGSKKSRAQTQSLFENFAFYCLEPYNSMSLKEFQDLLAYNGAVVVSSLTELSLQKDKHRVIILESEELSPTKISLLKKSKSVLASFEWIVDSLSQYHILSLVTYLYETTIADALELGFPPEYLVEEEEEEEDSQ